MSRTDRTRPYAVRVMEDPAFLEAYHRCVEHGQHNVRVATDACDLPPRPTGRAWAPGVRHNDTTCTWTPSHAFWRSSDGGACRCPHCMGEAYEMPRRLRERKQGKAATHDAQREYLHGDADDLSDVFDWTKVAEDPDFDNASDFHIEVQHFGALRDLLVADGDLPATSYVVDVREVWAYECCSDCDSGYLSHWNVEALHNDGRRETVRFDSDPWVLLANAAPAVECTR